MKEVKNSKKSQMFVESFQTFEARISKALSYFSRLFTSIL